MASSYTATDPVANERLMGQWSGRIAVRATSLHTRMGYTDFFDYWEPIANAQGPVGDYIKWPSRDQLDRLSVAVREAYLAGGRDGPRWMMATAWAARGAVP